MKQKQSNNTNQKKSDSSKNNTKSENNKNSNKKINKPKNHLLDDNISNTSADKNIYDDLFKAEDKKTEEEKTIVSQTQIQMILKKKKGK